MRFQKGTQIRKGTRAIRPRSIHTGTARAQSNLDTMTQKPQPTRVNMIQAPGYRDTYANSIQIRVSVWDFHLVFGQANSESPEQLSIQNHQGIFLSPQQAKALWNILGQNLAQYEQAFGELNLEPQNPNFPQNVIN